MLNYKIVENLEKNGLEVYFESKPEKETIETLKKHDFRWHKIKKCWYAKNTPTNKEMINNLEFQDVTSLDLTCSSKDGYMGANAWEGIQSTKKFWSVSEVNKLVKKYMKKKFNINVKTKGHIYSMGQSTTITMILSVDCLANFEEYKENMKKEDGWYRYHYKDESGEIKQMEFMYASSEIQEKMMIYAYEKTIEKLKSGDIDLAKHHKNIILNSKGEKLFEELQKFVNAFNYDDSNSMVDYFDRGFYESYKLEIRSNEKI